MSAQAVGGVVEHNPIGIIIPPPLGRMAVLLVMGGLLRKEWLLKVEQGVKK